MVAKRNQSTQRPADTSVPQAAEDRIGPLFKHAQRQLAALYEQALASHGVDVRQWAVLVAIDGQEPSTQQELAQRSGVDRTTMVMLIDSLQAKDLVGRRDHPTDRRKYVIELTPAGRRELRRATKAADQAEHQFLAALSGQQVRHLLDILRTLVATTPSQ